MTTKHLSLGPTLCSFPTHHVSMIPNSSVTVTKALILVAAVTLTVIALVMEDEVPCIAFSFLVVKGCHGHGEVLLCCF